MGRRKDLPERPLLVVYPAERYMPRLAETLMYQNALRVVARLFGVPESNVIGGWRLFFKPAHYAATEWHQDAAYRPPPHETISVWMPLDQATLESSCLSYIPGSHLGRVVRPHLHVGDHMVTEDVDPTQAVACPIPPTSATIHHTCTVHSAGPNKTDAPRRAFGIICRAA
jgi:ectoine hydroxylase-related dioxygenase (phytanoyl-CoA dioxygenase family)